VAPRLKARGTEAAIGPSLATAQRRIEDAARWPTA
jgi:hypothetical protein